MSHHTKKACTCEARGRVRPVYTTPCEAGSYWASARLDRCTQDRRLGRHRRGAKYTPFLSDTSSALPRRDSSGRSCPGGRAASSTNLAHGACHRHTHRGWGGVPCRARSPVGGDARPATSASCFACASWPPCRVGRLRPVEQLLRPVEQLLRPAAQLLRAVEQSLR